MSNPSASKINISSLKPISREDLAARILSTPLKSESSTLAAVDVRDSDYLGGHINGSINMPYARLVETNMPELGRLMEGKETVVFYCMLSMQRGPSAALAYARWACVKQQSRLEEQEARDRQQQQHEKLLTVEGQDETQKVEAGKKRMGSSSIPGLAQEVLLLEGGFSKWQEKYGNNEELTEGYVKDLWEGVF